MTYFAWPSNETQEAAANAGWTPDRRVDIGSWVSDLQAQGYSFFDEAVSVLSSMGGLIVRPPRIPEALWGSGSIRFDPLLAGDGMRERYAGFEQIIGHTILPIADWGGESAMLLLDDGSVVEDITGGLRFLGSSFPDALDLAVRRYRKLDLMPEFRQRP
ncbi:SUKH-3 domain-containing protein [Nocardia sp. NPDC058633]|uniref:SUKH-3 domain-containing protein n=1 Tax=Nocardia sp. NPDC058633 TaxID=3346568 RepID=UPI0036600010